MSSHYVYAIVNKINLKLYFGSHSWEGTGVDKNYYGSGKLIKRAVKKYGKDNFIVYPIKFYNSVEECRKAEEELLTKYNIAKNQYCYNIKNGAVGMTSEDMKGKYNPMYGRTGEKNPMYGKRGKDAPMYGKHHTEETRKKMSKAQKGKIVSEETRKKMSQANKGEKHPFYGKPRTENTRNKISQAHGGKPFAAIKDGKIKIFTSQHECSRVLGLHHSAINSCLKGKRKSTGGYTFKYIEQLESGIYEGML